jgi:hypothetical protein
LSNDSPDPFAIAARKALHSNNPMETISTVLLAYVEMVQPHNALEVLGLEKSDAPLLESQPPLASRILPWDFWLDGTTTSISHCVSEWESSSSRENLSHGLAQPYLQAGLPGFGPVSEEKVHSEAQRLHTLLQSIQKDGYYRVNGRNGDIEGTILYSNGEFRWFVHNGQHRASVLAALCKESIPLRVTHIAVRNEVEFWPNVRSGIYSEQGALRVFDRIFHATPSPVTNAWLSFAEATSFVELERMTETRR